MSSLVRTLGELALRALFALFVALAPAWAPPDVRTPTAQGTLALLAIALIACAIALSVVVARWARVDRSSAALVAATFLALPIAGVLYRDTSGPLLGAAFWLTPLVWLCLAAVTARVVVPRYVPRAPALARRAAFVAPLALGALLLFFARARLASPASLLRAALVSDPGSEPAALALAKLVEAKAPAEADRILRDCTATRPESCRCAEGLAVRALEREANVEALEAINPALTHCGESALRQGVRAEALTTLAPFDAASAADRALALDPGEPHALYAKALLEPQPEARRALAVRAVEHGRGVRAVLLLGFAMLSAGDLDGAAAQFEAVLRQRPDDTRAIYDLALIAQKRGRYREAREGYLRVLRLDPKLLDARFNLIVLTHDNGFDDEARHHLDALVAADPRNPGIARATGLLSAPAAAAAPAPTATRPITTPPAPSGSGR